MEEVQAFEGSFTLVLGLAQPSEFARAAGGVLEGGEELEVAAVTAEENLAQVDEAIDRFFKGGEFSGAVAIFVFHLAMVLEPDFDSSEYIGRPCW